MPDGTVDRIVAECNRLARVLGFDGWLAMIEIVKVDLPTLGPMLPEGEVSNLESALQDAYLKDLQHVIAPGSLTPIEADQLESLSKLLSEAPATEGQFRERLSQESEQQQRLYLEMVKKVTSLLASKRGDLEMAKKLLPHAPAGRRPIDETLQAEIVREVDRLHKGPPPLPKTTVVKMVASQRDISQRQIWRILKEYKSTSRTPPH